MEERSDGDGGRQRDGCETEPAAETAPRAQILVCVLVCCIALISFPRSIQAWHSHSHSHSSVHVQQSHCITLVQTEVCRVAWVVQCHFDAVIAHEKAIIPYPTSPPLYAARIDSLELPK